MENKLTKKQIEEYRDMKKILFKLKRSISLSRANRKELGNLKGDLRLNSFEEVIAILLKMKNIIFKLKRENSKGEVSGIKLYDKLVDGWIIDGYKIKE